MYIDAVVRRRAGGSEFNQSSQDASRLENSVSGRCSGLERSTCLIYLNGTSIYYVTLGVICLTLEFSFLFQQSGQNMPRCPY